MMFVCGVVDRDGNHRIFSAESRPTLDNLDELTRGVPVFSFNWGENADANARIWTARTVLEKVTDSEEAFRLAPLYAEAVVRGMESGRMWILPIEEIEAWLKENRKVA